MKKTIRVGAYTSNENGYTTLFWIEVFLRSISRLASVGERRSINRGNAKLNLLLHSPFDLWVCFPHPKVWNGVLISPFQIGFPLLNRLSNKFSGLEGFPSVLNQSALHKKQNDSNFETPSVSTNNIQGNFYNIYCCCHLQECCLYKNGYNPHEAHPWQYLLIHELYVTYIMTCIILWATFA